MKTISALQDSTEQSVYEKLEARDKETVDGFVEHCELWMGKEQTMPLLQAIIEFDDKRWPFLRASIAQHCPDLCAALDKIVNHIEKHRAEFIEEEAERLIEESKGDAS